eukprot:TRINITY_DN25539_c0_g1_i1.p1 TRINITY_DN25539_c0_g1~~TRINITY_DN25539_c0_g1_i1.p1  ORF type:complete len:554 (-),score=106.31 TRINITY_DN25539_c0_g1_i1:102-1763(-)
MYRPNVQRRNSNRSSVISFDDELGGRSGQKADSLRRYSEKAAASRRSAGSGRISSPSSPGSPRSARTPRKFGSPSEVSTNPGSPSLYSGDSVASPGRRVYAVAHETRATMNPVHGRESKLISADNRAATTSMSGPNIIKEQEDLGSTVAKFRQHRQEQLKEDKANHDVKVIGFNDRMIRAQDGSAMKTIFSPREGAEEAEEAHREKHRMKHHETPMKAALAAAAGHVIQVDIAGQGKPPYLLQTDYDGIMPAVNFLSPVLSRGHFKVKQSILDDEAAHDHELHARGCDPPGKFVDRLRQSKGVTGAMNSDPVDQKETEALLRHHLGKKGSHPRIERRDPIVEGNPYDRRLSRSHSARAYVGHKFLPGGGVAKSVLQESADNVVPGWHGTTGTCEPKWWGKRARVRGPGQYGVTGFSEQTNERTLRDSPEVRFCQNKINFAKRATSNPPESFHGRFLHHNLDDIESPISSPRAQSPHMESPRIQEVLSHPTVRDVQSARESRKLRETDFANACESARQHKIEHNRLVQHTRSSIHHMDSHSVSSLLAWPASLDK